MAVVAVAGSWLAAGFLSGRPAALPRDEALPVSQTEVGRVTTRLALNLKTLASPSRTVRYTPPVRNPFQFDGRQRASASARAGTPVRLSPSHGVSSLAPGLPPERPPMQLSGVAEDPGPQGPVRRAVIAAANELFLAGVGDLVLGRFRVTRIDAEAVELEDLQGGPMTILALR